MVQDRNGDEDSSAPTESGLDFQGFQDARTRKIQARDISDMRFNARVHRLIDSNTQAKAHLLHSVAEAPGCL